MARETSQTHQLAPAQQTTRPDHPNKLTERHYGLALLGAIEIDRAERGEVRRWPARARAVDSLLSGHGPLPDVALTLKEAVALAQRARGERRRPSTRLAQPYARCDRGVPTRRNRPKQCLDRRKADHVAEHRQDALIAHLHQARNCQSSRTRHARCCQPSLVVGPAIGDQISQVR